MPSLAISLLRLDGHTNTAAAPVPGIQACVNKLLSFRQIHVRPSLRRKIAYT
jgi:hypothetical protein